MKCKIILPLVIFVLFADFANAQTEKGKLMVGASTSNFSFVVQRQFNSFDIRLRPRVGYFFFDNFVAGAELILGYSVVRSNGTTDSWTFTKGGGLFGRYYVPITPKLKLPMEVSLGIDGYKSISGIETYTGRKMTTKAMTGLSYFLNSNTSLDFLVGYERQLFINNGPQFSRGSLAGSLGFNIYLDTKKAGTK